MHSYTLARENTLNLAFSRTTSLKAGDRSESAWGKEFKRMLAQEIDESYALSRLPKGPLSNTIPRSWSNRNLLLGFHPLGVLATKDELRRPPTWYNNTEQKNSPLSKGAEQQNSPESPLSKGVFTPKLSSLSPSSDDKLDLLRQRVEGLAIAEAPALTVRCDSFSDSQSSASSHQEDIFQRKSLSRRTHLLPKRQLRRG